MDLGPIWEALGLFVGGVVAAGGTGALLHHRSKRRNRSDPPPAGPQTIVHVGGGGGGPLDTGEWRRQLEEAGHDVVDQMARDLRTMASRDQPATQQEVHRIVHEATSQLGQRVDRQLGTYSRAIGGMRQEVHELRVEQAGLRHDLDAIPCRANPPGPCAPQETPQ